MSQPQPKVFKKSSLPVFVLAGAFLFFALVLELFKAFVYEQPAPKPATQTAKTTSGFSENVFDGIPSKFPNYKNEHSDLELKNVGFSAHNFSKGNARSKVVVTVFNDLDCALCLSNMDKVMKDVTPYLDKILFVYKHLPKNEQADALTPMFAQIAISEGVFEKFLEVFSQSVEAPNEVEDYLVLLEKSGVSLQKQRQIMTYEMARILKNVDDDMEKAKSVGAYDAKTKPVVFVGGYQLGKSGLFEYKMKEYIERLIDGDSIVPNS